MAYLPQRSFAVGDGELRDKLTSEPVKTVSALALTYHGYKRTGKVGWALAYGLLGRLFPLVAVPVALAQGLGKKKGE